MYKDPRIFHNLQNVEGWKNLFPKHLKEKNAKEEEEKENKENGRGGEGEEGEGGEGKGD